MSDENQSNEERDILEGILTKFFDASVYKRDSGFTSSVRYVRICDEKFGFPPVSTLDFHVGPARNGLRNGFLIEEVIACVVHRIQTLNAQVSCPENLIAIRHLKDAILVLEGRGARIAAEKATAVGGPGGLGAGNATCTPVNKESDGQK